MKSATSSLARGLRIGLFSAVLVSSAGAFAQAVIVTPAPPPVRAEVVPAPRAGYAWDRGHWIWARGRYVWAPGRWRAQRIGYAWVPGHWAPRGPRWVWIEGHWRR